MKFELGTKIHKKKEINLQVYIGFQNLMPDNQK